MGSGTACAVKGARNTNRKGEGTMPIYEFKCSVCGAVAEVLQRIDASAPFCSECPQDAAQARPMVKQVSRSSFVLKGGGWASDGYQ